MRNSVNTDVFVSNGPDFITRIARSDDDMRAAQRLRYAVFVQELGGDGTGVDHKEQLESDHFDAFADHLLLLDVARHPGDQVVGVTRVMTDDMARAAGQFYCAEEYDLTVLHHQNARRLELGRSCLHPDYRGGTGMQHLWAGLADYIQTHDIDLLFGVASFHGTDARAFAAPLSLLHHRHLAPPSLRVKAKGPTAVPMDIIAASDLDRVSAVRQMPALIKAYLRLGATVGEGAFVDHAFNTTDICLILQKDAIGALSRAIYTRGARRV